MSNMRDVLRQLEREGATLVYGSRHIKVRDRAGRLIAVVPSKQQSGNGRQFANLLATLRRAGFLLKGRH